MSPLVQSFAAFVSILVAFGMIGAAALLAVAGLLSKTVCDARSEGRFALLGAFGLAFVGMAVFAVGVRLIP